jgi:radical SAM superfamily enzyme YgiQ (UPF0313 family)
MSPSRRSVLLVQLPIPPPGPQAVRHNVPLAAGYLKLFARKRGLENRGYQIGILPPPLANTLGDQGLVEEILSRQPGLVGFTCYLWNVERTLWIAERLKQARPELRIVLGGPEITADNRRVLDHPAVDYAVVGEGEQALAELLESSPSPRAATRGLRKPARVHAPLASLDEVSSPYLEGILDAADEQAMFLETMRGCRSRCKFCYYPKGYRRISLVSPEKIAANLRHAIQRGAREVVLLDPTLNQRPDFEEFLRLLARNNPGQQLALFGELRAEGIDARSAALLKAANFAEVEVGLQSVDKLVQRLMGRRVNLKGFRDGVRAMLDVGIRVHVDLILGLPGETRDSFSSSVVFLYESRLYSAVQVFNLSILPGTEFRREAEPLGLKYQARPPYYVLQTPTLTTEDMYELMDEVQDAFGLEYDPVGPPMLDIPENASGPIPVARIDLDQGPARLPPAARRAQAFTLWLRSADFDSRREGAAGLIRQVLADNPHTTLQVILDPTADPQRLTARALETFLGACYSSSSYLDLYYGLHPSPLLGAKRLVVLLPGEERARLEPGWIEQVGQYATLVWHGGARRRDAIPACATDRLNPALRSPLASRKPPV